MKNFKKMIFLLAMVLATSALTVSAAENEVENVYIQLDDISGLNPEDYEEANARLMEIGRMAQMAKGYKFLNVSHYFQNGKSWSNDIMQTCGSTIGAAGCCLTSFTMIADYYGSDDNPGEVNTVLGNDACPFSYRVAGQKYGLAVSSLKMEAVSDADAKTFIIGAITAGNPVLVGMTSEQNGTTHFVAAYGYRDNTIYINDPASNRNYKTLDEYLSTYYVHRLCVYTD